MLLKHCAGNAGGLSNGRGVALNSASIELKVSSLEHGTTTIYKAPQRGMGKKLLEQGFHPEDFATGDMRAYFAKERKLAEEFAEHYGEGVLDVEMLSDIYDARIKKYEQ